jgi:hypothetical protein
MEGTTISPLTLILQFLLIYLLQIFGVLSTTIESDYIKCHSNFNSNLSLRHFTNLASVNSFKSNIRFLDINHKI